MDVYHLCQRHRRLNLVTDFQLSPVSLLSTTNLLPVTTTPVNWVRGQSMDASFHGGSNETIGGRVRLRRPDISPFWFEVVWRSQGSLIRVCELSMDGLFHGGSNYTTGGRVWLRRPETQSPIVSLEPPWKCAFINISHTLTPTPLNISANFQKNLKQTQRNTQRPGGHWFVQKNLKSKIPCQTPFKGCLRVTVSAEHQGMCVILLGERKKSGKHQRIW